MKKASILIMTSFYLLLNTGMFVCTVHCVAEAMIAKTEMQMKGADGCRKMGLCRNNKDAGCCKKHGSFLIKENIKPASGVQFSSNTYLEVYRYLNTIKLHGFLPDYISSGIADNSPPGNSGSAIFIKIRSLQI